VEIRWLSSFLILLLPGVSLSCHSPAWTEQDSWYKAPPEGVSWQALPGARFTPVVNVDFAVQLLDSTSIVRLGSAQLSLLGVEELSGGRELFLVRAVCLGCDPTGFSVSQSEDGLLIRTSHGTLGRRPLPMKRHALVVALDAPPREVYPICSMAE
jgi:hypothetical protein